MSWNFYSQFADLIVSLVLAIHLVRLRLHLAYLALFAFVLFDCLQALSLISFRGLHHPFDYRLLYDSMTCLGWTTTIWMVYAVLSAILKSLPGILRFSLWFLNIVFVAWIAISLSSSGSAYNIYRLADYDFLARTTALVQVLDARFSLALLLVILSVLLFILRFPIPVPRNLSAFSIGICIFFLMRIIVLLLFNYFPNLHDPKLRYYGPLASLSTNVEVLCFVYWIFVVNKAGEKAEVILGPTWQSVRKEHLVRQLEAMNAALLRSREQSS